MYNDHGKSDPFMPLVSADGTVVNYDKDLSVNDLVLEGVVVDASGRNVAVVHGKIVKVHDQIGSYVVDAIVFDHVEFLKGTERFILKIKRPNS